MKKQPIRLLLVDDHSMVRMGFATLLAAEKDFQVVAEAEDAAQALAAYRQHQPDVTLMDVRMPGGSGLSALQQIREHDPDARVIILTTYDLDEPVINAFEWGAAGYLLKSVKRDELVAAVRLVHRGERCFPAAIEQRLAQRVAANRLTRRELETLTMLRRGLSNKDIGVAMDISENTAKAHVKALLKKLEAADRAEAVATGFEKGLLELE